MTASWTDAGGEAEGEAKGEAKGEACTGSSALAALSSEAPSKLSPGLHVKAKLPLTLACSGGSWSADLLGATALLQSAGGSHVALPAEEFFGSY